MIPGYGPLTQTALGTLLTWGLTAAGAGMVVFFHGTQRKLLDSSLGFAGGVMVAASYWSLLAPAIEMAEESKQYGAEGEYAFIPVAVGFLCGCLFVYGADIAISELGGQSPDVMLALSSSNGYCKKSDDLSVMNNGLDDLTSVEAPIDGFYEGIPRRRGGPVSVRQRPVTFSYTETITDNARQQWKRILLLIVAITIHNIPEGLAVGVAFAAVGSSPSATFETARNLAIGIGIQNFPEGLAVSLPLQAAGFSTFKSFWYGQLSGMVEPVAGLLGAAALTYAHPLLPYALAFAAGAMIYVVFDDIVPEAHASGNGKLASWGAVIGFIVMMSLDVGLG